MTFNKIIKSQAFKDFSIIIFILGLATILFHITDWDIAVERYFYSNEKGWLLQYSPFWDFLYKFGIFPGYIFALSGLIMISLSYWNAKFLKYRKPAILMVFTLIIGPGLLVNLIFKDHMGRPRPRDIKEFSGTEQFICVCVKGDSIEGKSFPCGHCAMGFYMAIPFLFLRNRRKIMAYSFLGIGIIYGIIIGIARMMAGGHFLSDVIWAGGLVWITALIGFYLFKVDRPIEIPVLSQERQKKRARVVTFLVAILLPVITAGIIIATPYISKKSLIVNNSDLRKSKTKVILADMMDATVHIKNDTSFQVNYKVNGFGFPNSKIRGTWITGDTGKYTIQALGWFTEVKNDILLKIPMVDSIIYIIKINGGKIYCDLPEKGLTSFSFTVNEGNIYLKMNSNLLTLVGDSSKVENKKFKKLDYLKQKPKQWSGNLIEYHVIEGKIIIE
jgi:lipid A 4'-phosphatase